MGGHSRAADALEAHTRHALKCAKRKGREPPYEEMQRHLKPGIFIELAPTGEGETSAWLQRRAQIGKSAGRLREKHDAKARKKESGRFELIGRRVGAYKFDRGAPWQPFGSPPPASALKRQCPAPLRKGQRARRARSSSHQYRSRYRRHARPAAAALAFGRSCRFSRYCGPWGP
jgi:hypothetical protein